MTTEPNDDLTSSDEVEIDLSAGFADDLETASDAVEVNLDFGVFSESIERDVELDPFFNAQDAKAYGLIDEVLERRPEDTVKPG